MSLFNLDRFRFEKKTTKRENRGSNSPESEKENKPAAMKPVKAGKTQPVRGVVFEDAIVSSESDDDVIILEPKIQHSLSRTLKSPAEKPSNHVADGDNSDAKLETLSEMFPQITRNELQKIISRTSTLEGAVAACLIEHGDKEDQSKKRKKEDKSNSKPNKKTKSSTVSEDEDEECKREKQEAMVRKLQKRFPSQIKEELQIMLQEHDWNMEDCLHFLEMFSEQENTSLSSEEAAEKKPSKSKCKNKSYTDSETADKKVSVCPHVSETENSSDDTDRTKDSEDSDSDEAEAPHKKRSTSLFSSWIKTTPNSTFKKTEPSSSSSQKPSSSSSALQTQSRLTSGTNKAKLEAAMRKKKARESIEHTRSDDDEEDDDDDDDMEEEIVESEFEDFDDKLESAYKGKDMKSRMVEFFQESSVDELTLISGCSLKRAQKIVELRPFNTWSSLTKVFHKANGLSESLLQGCKVVLKERQVVLELMSRCRTISSKMEQEVTVVTQRGTGTMKQPEVLNSQLQMKPYQLIGLKWLLLLHEHKLSGILADEMGLGKTIQAIAFLAQLLQNGIEGPHLIIVPASTLDNWARELKLWCPDLKVLLYYGSMEDRRYLKHDILNQDVEFNVIVSTYSIAISNSSDRSLFRKLRLTYAVFDEGHMLKNMNSLRYHHLMAINARHRLLLTGTPLQNNLLELMSLLNFIMPSMFSSSTSELSRMFSMKSHQEQSSFERNRISQAKLIMKPFILRRVKSEVLKQLPAKEERVELCSMSENQQRLYQNLFKKLKTSITGEKRELCNVMMQLRKMANHPLLHRQYYTTEKLKAMSKLMLKEPTHFDADAVLIQEDMEVMSDFELHRLCQRYTSISRYQLEQNLLLDSGKFVLLTQLLGSLHHNGDRVVLFSQFTMMLDIVEVLLKHLKYRYVRLDGSTPIADRIVLIDEFNNDKDIFVFLLSTRAGGLGINLTSANVVILHDIDWNPYNDKQAEDRCHRVGQTRIVQVIKLISKDTIEDCILQLGNRKLKLEQDMTAAEQSLEGNIPEDMASLLKTLLGL
ncbi:SWI/SNF-related matrix-associated actin-dependent regulator of chromatin subfamily A containing DEAD/H box 1A isoform X2 [Gouania willdenowi]|uniref:DNA helicase n=1 Tax=Gouania willdenowi TaxID=441366 RepID=A0A8C5DPM3_GOUWI|nr:SWI/SNF-related matrix-associated actin-dependent regulator of chromatin subfamily A containing DEAD/H box 1 isoform X2 [Gouania willdenowi]